MNLNQTVCLEQEEDPSQSSQCYTKGYTISVYHRKHNRESHHVDRRMYCFQASLPDSRPPPVSFSPPGNTDIIIHSLVIRNPYQKLLQFQLHWLGCSHSLYHSLNQMVYGNIDQFLVGLYGQSCLPHPLKHFANILGKEAACETLAHFIVPCNTFLKTLYITTRLSKTTLTRQINSQNTLERKGLGQTSLDEP